MWECGGGSEGGRRRREGVRERECGRGSEGEGVRGRE